MNLNYSAFFETATLTAEQKLPEISGGELELRAHIEVAAMAGRMATWCLVNCKNKTEEMLTRFLSIQREAARQIEHCYSKGVRLPEQYTS